MKFKKLLSLTLVGIISGSLLIGCSKASGEADKNIKVGASVTPHAEILEAAKPLLEKKGYKLEIVEFDDYVLPNTSLAEGELDANFFQHIPYLEQMNEEKNLNLTYTAKVLIAPIGVYSEKYKSLDELKDGAKISVPNDATNETRALKLLADNKIIEVAQKELLTAKDITKNPKNIEIVEVEAAQVPSTLQDVDYAVINSNFALNVKLNPKKDAIAIESSDSPYVNVLACRQEDKESEKIKVLGEVLNSDEIRSFIEEKYEGSIIPTF
ncbi:MetQ/NlpA family ABC transporter substrate-binding protein [Terrisporobacter vanillatitrophus]|uniref:MetQ/NlpA family ABC transporter substrate-binding protein n=1 Tax=Terrisporobacter vanillatitrophus TaxID=3058402 RepID=UPI0033688724